MGPPEHLGRYERWWPGWQWNGPRTPPSKTPAYTKVYCRQEGPTGSQQSTRVVPGDPQQDVLETSPTLPAFWRH